MNDANKKARRPAGYRPFWESVEKEMETKVETPPAKYDFPNLRNRLIGNSTAAEVATEEAKKLKKRMGR